MFDIGWSEMLLILLVALVVIGPRDLPRVARTMGHWVAKGRAMAREFQHALADMAREAELDKVKSEIEKAGRTNLGKAVENTIDPTGELGKAFDPIAKSAPKTATKAAGSATPATAMPPASRTEPIGPRLSRPSRRRPRRRPSLPMPWPPSPQPEAPAAASPTSGQGAQARDRAGRSDLAGSIPGWR